MSVTTVEPDLDNLTLTVVADFEASVEEVWELWANSEKLGRWWGPPEYLTTFALSSTTRRPLAGYSFPLRMRKN